MSANRFELALEDAREAMSGPLRGQAGRFPTLRLQSILRRQGFLATRHFADRFHERAQAQGIRFNPRPVANDFRAAPHFRQTQPGNNTRIVLSHGLPVVYRMGDPRGHHPKLVSLLPADQMPAAVPIAPPVCRKPDFEWDLESATEQTARQERSHSVLRLYIS